MDPTQTNLKSSKEDQSAVNTYQTLLLDCLLWVYSDLYTADQFHEKYNFNIFYILETFAFAGWILISWTSIVSGLTIITTGVLDVCEMQQMSPG